MVVTLDAETIGTASVVAGAILTVGGFVIRAVCVTKAEFEDLEKRVNDLRNDTEKGFVETKADSAKDAAAINALLRADLSAQMERDRNENKAQFVEVLKVLEEIKHFLHKLDVEQARINERSKVNQE